MTQTYSISYLSMKAGNLEKYLLHFTQKIHLQALILTPETLARESWIGFGLPWESRSSGTIVPILSHLFPLQTLPFLPISPY